MQLLSSLLLLVAVIAIGDARGREAIIPSSDLAVVNALKKAFSVCEPAFQAADKSNIKATEANCLLAIKQELKTAPIAVRPGEKGFEVIRRLWTAYDLEKNGKLPMWTPSELRPSSTANTWFGQLGTNAIRDQLNERPRGIGK